MYDLSNRFFQFTVVVVTVVRVVYVYSGVLLVYVRLRKLIFPVAVVWRSIRFAAGFSLLL